MAEKQVRIDLVAADQASPVIDDVAAAAKDLEGLDPTVTVEAEAGQAKRTVEDLVDSVKSLDARDATVVLKMRAGAVSKDLASILTDVETLDASDPEVTVKLAAAADARADLDKLSTALAEIDSTTVSPKIDTSGVEHFRGETDKARDATHSFAGNALSEIPGVGSTFGPLGESISQMTEGLLAGEIAMGGLIAAAGPIAAITIGVKLVTDYFARQKKAAEEAAAGVEEWRKALEKTNGVRLSAIDDQLRQLIRTNEDFAASIADTNEVFGFTAADLAAALDGTVSPALQQVIDYAQEYRDAQEEIADLPSGTDETTTILRNLGKAHGFTAEEAKRHGEAAKDLSEELETQGVRLDQASTAADNERDALKGLKAPTTDLGDAQETMGEQVNTAADAIAYSNDQLDIMRGRLDLKRQVKELGGTLVEQMALAKAGVKATDDQVQTLEDQVFTTAAEFNRSPIEVQTALEAIERGDFAAVWGMVQGWMTQQPLHQPVTLDVKLNRSEIADFLSAQGLTLTAGGTMVAPAAPAVQVTQVFPRGFRAASVIAEAQHAARRNGALYRRAVR